jgi:hypothetical protein
VRYAVITFTSRPGGTVRTFNTLREAALAAEDEWNRVGGGARGYVMVIDVQNDRVITSIAELDRARAS